MSRRRPLTVSSGRNPFEITLLVAAVSVGIGLVTTGDLPPSAGEAMPSPVQPLWLTLLVTGGVIALAGVWWPGRLVTGVRVEQAGVAMLGAGCGMYAIALFATAALQALAAGGFVGAVAIACFWRAAQIMRDLRRVARASLVAAVPLLIEEEADECV